jgi:subtilisin family serine protease
MLQVRYGGRTARPHRLVEAANLLAVRTEDHQEILQRPFATAELSDTAWQTLDRFEREDYFVQAGVQLFRAKATTTRPRAARDEARRVLKRQKAVAFAGRVLCDARSHQPVLYTENLFVQFGADIAESACRRLLKSYGVTVKRPLDYARNAYFVEAAEGIGQKVFPLAERILNDAKVVLCHPELIRRAQRKGAFAPQWHLKKTTIDGTVVDESASVEAAWSLTTGAGATIAIIDDGVDIDHEELRTSGKILAPRDATFSTNNPRPGNGDRHGTACAGVACANGNFRASGVAPGARLIPIRLASELGSQNEADAFVWAAQNGADVISCSWGPADGDFRDPNDPTHLQNAPLPDSTRLAIDFAATQGRGGKGCVVLFAAGNGNESVDLDGYASHQNVIAVAACNDRGKKSPYSDFGNAIWCAFPSNNFFPSLTKGIWTMDNTGNTGYNPGDLAKGDAAGNYTNSFGGTSSACPGAAGVAALVIARNPQLRREEVREILKQCADKIDTAGGNYDAQGRSPLYGFGRLNARRAVELAVPATATPVVEVTVTQDVPIKDLKTSTVSLQVAESRPAASLSVAVDIEHTFIGDLEVSLVPPAGIGVPTIKLHDREGGPTDNLRRSYNAGTTPALGAVQGKALTGKWTLRVRDQERADEGRIRSVTLTIVPA